MTGYDKLMTGFTKACHAVSGINPRTCKRHDEHDTISRVRLLHARMHERVSGKSPSCSSCKSEALDFTAKSHDGHGGKARHKPVMFGPLRPPTPAQRWASLPTPPLAIRPETSERAPAHTTGRPGSSTRLRAAQATRATFGPGEDEGSDDGGELDPYAASTLSPYEAALGRGGLLDVLETDETEAFGGGCARPSASQPSTTAGRRGNLRGILAVTSRHRLRFVGATPRNSVGKPIDQGRQVVGQAKKKFWFTTGGAHNQ